MIAHFWPYDNKQQGCSSVILEYQSSWCNKLDSILNFSVYDSYQWYDFLNLVILPPKIPPFLRPFAGLISSSIDALDLKLGQDFAETMYYICWRVNMSLKSLVHHLPTNFTLLQVMTITQVKTSTWIQFIKFWNWRI